MALRINASRLFFPAARSEFWASYAQELVRLDLRDMEPYEIDAYIRSGGTFACGADVVHTWRCTEAELEDGNALELGRSIVRAAQRMAEEVREAFPRAHRFVDLTTEWDVTLGFKLVPGTDGELRVQLRCAAPWDEV